MWYRHAALSIATAFVACGSPSQKDASTNKDSFLSTANGATRGFWVENDLLMRGSCIGDLVTRDNCRKDVQARHISAPKYLVNVTLTRAIRENEQQQKAYQDVIDQWQRAQPTIAADRADLVKKSDELAATLPDLDAKKSGYEKDLRDLSTQKDATNARLAVASSEQERLLLRASLKRIQAEIAAVNDKVTPIVQLIIHQRVEIENTNGRIADLDRHIAERTKNAADAEEKLAALKKAMPNLLTPAEADTAFARISTEFVPYFIAENDASVTRDARILKLISEFFDSNKTYAVDLFESRDRGLWPNGDAKVSDHVIGQGSLTSRHYPIGAKVIFEMSSAGFSFGRGGSYELNVADDLEKHAAFKIVAQDNYCQVKQNNQVIHAYECTHGLQFTVADKDGVAVLTLLDDAWGPTHDLSAPHTFPLSSVHAGQFFTMEFKIAESLNTDTHVISDDKLPSFWVHLLP